MICRPCFSHSRGHTLVVTNHNVPDPWKCQASHHPPPTPFQLTSSASPTPTNLTPPEPTSHGSARLYPDLHYRYAFTSFLPSFNSIALHFKHFLSCTLSRMSHLTGRAPTLVKFNFLPFLILASVQLNVAEEKHSCADWSHFNYDHSPQRGYS